MSDLSKEDKLLLKQAFADVTPIKATRVEHFNSHADNQTKSKAVNKINHTRRYISKENHLIKSERRIEQLPSGAVNWFDPSLRPQDIKALRQGHYPCHGELDLHGFTEDTATQKLTDFLYQQQHNGARMLRIIHGKGYNSPAGPVVKQVVLRLLEHFPGLLGVCSAQPKDGDTGAVYVLFQKQRQNAKRDEKYS